MNDNVIERCELTEEEYNVIDNFIRLTKMDSWFKLKTDADGDYVFDAEENKYMSLRDALELFNETVEPDLLLDKVSNEDISVYEELMDRLELEHPF